MHIVSANAAEPGFTHAQFLRISLCTDIAQEKKLHVYPNLNFKPVFMKFNFSELLAYKHNTSEYAAHQGNKELVSVVSV